MKKILVVDNDRILLNLMRRLLEKEGFQVETAQNGIEAIDIIMTYTPDIMFVDLIMPSIDGGRLCKIIRNIDRLKDVKIIILSAAVAEEGIEPKQLLADAYIVKGPFNETSRHVINVIKQLNGSADHPFGDEILGEQNMNPRVLTQELLDIKRHYETILESMQEGAVEINPEGRITYANPSFCSLVNLPEHKIFASHFVDLFSGDDHRRLSEFLEKEKLKPKTISEDFPLMLNQHQVSMYFLPLEKFEHTCIIINDVTQRKCLEEELKAAIDAANKANSIKSKFLADMSHEIRTPLNHIIGFTELIVDKKLGDINEVQYEYLCDVLDSGNLLLSIVNEILDLSKLEAGKTPFTPEEIYLKALLENCLQIVHENGKKDNIQLQLNYQEAPETITADESKLKQIIYNLLSNAVKFTPPGGRVSLQARRVDCFLRPAMRKEDPKDLKILINKDEGAAGEGLEESECVEISVTDTGIGLESNDLERIFKPFEQIQHAESKKNKGTGLGLAITKRYVELHGGRIWVESQGQGKGCKFAFLIPK